MPVSSSSAPPRANRPVSGALFWLASAALAARIVAAAALIFGPWTNEAGELAGWDIERFWEIAGINGRHWVDEAVEYPPGSVVLIEAFVGSSIVAAHRLLVAMSLVVDIALAAVLDRWVDRRAAAAYLLLGLPLLPGGLVRFDLWVAMLATLALIALPRHRPGLFGAIVAAGAAIKIMPVVLVAVAIATGHYRSAVAAAGLGMLAVGGWIAYGSTDAIGQVLSLRDATGWHVESLPGSLIALFGDETSRLEADAFRIGTMSSLLANMGRLIFVTAAVALGFARAGRPSSDHHPSDAVMVLGMLAALVVTAPLLSPQFLLWLTPFAAIAASTLGWRHPLVATAAATIVITGATLAVFGPPNLHATAPAAMLTMRNLGLIAIVILAWRELQSDEPVIDANEACR